MTVHAHNKSTPTIVAARDSALPESANLGHEILKGRRPNPVSLGHDILDIAFWAISNLGKRKRGAVVRTPSSADAGPLVDPTLSAKAGFATRTRSIGAVSTETGGNLKPSTTPITSVGS